MPKNSLQAIGFIVWGRGKPKCRAVSEAFMPVDRKQSGLELGDLMPLGMPPNSVL